MEGTSDGKFVVLVDVGTVVGIAVSSAVGALVGFFDDGLVLGFLDDGLLDGFAVGGSLEDGDLLAVGMAVSSAVAVYICAC